MSGDLVRVLKKMLSDVCLFSRYGAGIRLRMYQQQAARSIVDSVIHERGLSFVVLFPRQSGKNEVQAQIEAYLLTLYSHAPAEIVKVSPTWKPQSLNAMRRLERVLQSNLITRGMWTKESGYIYRVGRARITFLSGSPEANIVGATASTLLEVDEAQDVQIAKFDKDIAPMAASTNATRVFWGTAWTSNTLLARELRAAREAQAVDGIARVFRIDAGVVAAELPAYGAFVAGQVARFGRQHPMIRTQFFSEELDAEGGMFTAQRMALMRGSHPRQRTPTVGRVYALLIDVAGEDENAAEPGALHNPRRDATALTVVEVRLDRMDDPAVRAPVYQVVDRRLWTGVRHTRLFAELLALAELWNPRQVVIDATGVGAGLASFLERALPGRVIPFVFSSVSKSKLGWDFLAVIETGRFKDWAGDEPGDERAEFDRQALACQMEALPGPERRLRWGVPDGTRDPASGAYLHDDALLSAALCAVLDEQPWTLNSPALIVRAADPLTEMDKGFQPRIGYQKKDGNMIELLYPLPDSYPLSQGFGENPAAYARFKLPGHNGLDFAVPTGTAVLAAADGRVVETGSDPAGYGLFARLDHGAAQTLYGHLSRIDARAGQPVTAGSVLGLSGSSGNSSGPHLHFELRIAGGGEAGYQGALDPLPYLSARGPSVLNEGTPGGLRFEVVNAPFGLRVRSGPGVQYAVVGLLRAGELVTAEALDHSERWVRLSAGRYAAAQFGDDVYLQEIDREDTHD